MKVLTVVGARPQFIKAAVVSHEIERHANMTELLVHTGQHYDHDMSEVFFDELDIPHPEVNLGISGGTHAQMTGRMLIALEEVMAAEQPDAVLLYGDTNSTLAGALSAAKLHLPIAHVEAGVRTHSRTNPEEVNRVCADHVSSLLLASTKASMDNLEVEGLGDLSLLVGDPMYDAFLKYTDRMRQPELVSLIGNERVALPDGFYYLTCHREENTRDPSTLANILDAMEQLESPVVYPVHPRNANAAKALLEKAAYPNVLFVQPVGYLESLYLVNHAKQVVTDSGGLQREAFFAGVKCTTLLDFVCWPETMVCGRNTLSRPVPHDILETMGTAQSVDESYHPFGDGHSSAKIVTALLGSYEGGIG